MGLFLIHLEPIDKYVHTPSKTIPDSRPKWANSVTVFTPKRRKNHTLGGARYLYGLSKGFPPTRGINKPILGRDTLWF